MIRRLFEWLRWGEIPSLSRFVNPTQGQWTPGNGLPDDLNETVYITLMWVDETGGWDVATNCGTSVELLQGLADTLASLLSGNFEDAE